LHDALGKFQSQFALYSSAERIWWTYTGSRVSFCHAHTQETGPGSRYAQQCALLLMRDMVRLAAGPTWQPDVVFSAPSMDPMAMQGAFEGAHVRRSKFSGFAFPVDFLSLPFARFREGDSGDRDLEAFEASAPATDFVGSIRQVVSSLMSLGKCQIGEIANAVGMHPRTLQRRLSDLQMEFSAILADVRFEAALRMINDPRLSVIDIAYDLGYTDPSNFTRAFRHWTGVTPSEFRKRRREHRPARTRS
jgi:AraC-like DNA-binding protein